MKLNLAISFLFIASIAAAQTKFKPEDTEFYTPKPHVVHVPGGVPDDALVLFDGRDLVEWQSVKDTNQAAPWLVEEGVLTVKGGAGDIQTKKKFGDFQLHIEWKSPELIKGEGQGRGNSGVFLQGLYEVQVLDNTDNPTYVNGQAGSIYKQRPPLVEVRSEEDGWHRYDLIYHAPQFNRDGMLVRKATLTLLHNGVLVQDQAVIEGTTEYIGLPKMMAHGVGPLILQDHGNPVHFRNIWIRPL
ncbi:3-keto-disaccharide hydrolase [Sphingobacterium sp. LRF_L2]|uniref:3-keto-disaccharide hydrolase n=1 Tax=Sphingobacterium sp. LRF_L2 TaxID=3369421 RepID=UPI003F5EB115